MDGCEKRAFSPPENAKKENQLEHKYEVRNCFLWTVRSSSMKDYICHYGVCT